MFTCKNKRRYSRERAFQSFKFHSQVAELRFDTVIASDCVYLLDTLDDLLATLAGAGPHHEVILSYEDRSSGVEKEFFQRAKDRGWIWDEVSVEGNDYYAPEIHILRMKLRSSQPAAD